MVPQLAYFQKKFYFFNDKDSVNIYHIFSLRYNTYANADLVNVTVEEYFESIQTVLYQGKNSPEDKINKRLNISIKMVLLVHK